MATKSWHVEIYDSTLRDGTQAEAVSFSSEDKVHIAEMLDRIGVNYIEGGWPGSNPKDMDFFEPSDRNISQYLLNLHMIWARSS